MKLNIIVAMCNKTRGMGHNKILPHINNYNKYFQKLTMGNGNNAIIMGRNTWQTLPKKPLFKRKNIILSSTLQHNDNASCMHNNNNNLVSVFNNFDNLILNLEKQEFDDIWIIGGEKIYKLFLKHNLISKIYITSIETQNELKYNTHFPTFLSDFKLEYKSPTIEEIRVYGPTLIKYKYNFEIYNKIN
jgi:dihydrofolate reductase